MKIVGGDTFYSYYILYKYFQIRKFAKNSNIIRSSKKAQAVFPIFDKRALHNF